MKLGQLFITLCILVAILACWFNDGARMSANSADWADKRYSP
jgi:hypothetical protein